MWHRPPPGSPSGMGAREGAGMGEREGGQASERRHSGEVRGLVYRLSVTLVDDRGNVIREMGRTAPPRDASLRWWPSDVFDFTHAIWADASPTTAHPRTLTTPPESLETR